MNNRLFSGRQPIRLPAFLFVGFKIKPLAARNTNRGENTTSPASYHK